MNGVLAHDLAARLKAEFGDVGERITDAGQTPAGRPWCATVSGVAFVLVDGEELHAYVQRGGMMHGGIVRDGRIDPASMFHEAPFPELN